MLVDRVLADLDVPADEDRGGRCRECDAPTRCKGLCGRHYDKARYAANRAMFCAQEKARGKARYWSDPEAGRAVSREKQRRRRALDPDLSKREATAWRDADRPRAREISRRNMRLYRQRHPERARASRHLWAATHPEQIRELARAFYRKDYARRPALYYAKYARRRALRSAAALGDVDYDAVLIRDAGRCGICGEPVAPRDLNYDHISPLARGGAHTTENLQVAHERCNKRKGARCS